MTQKFQIADTGRYEGSVFVSGCSPSSMFFDSPAAAIEWAKSHEKPGACLLAPFAAVDASALFIVSQARAAGGDSFRLSRIESYLRNPKEFRVSKNRNEKWCNDAEAGVPSAVAAMNTARREARYGGELAQDIADRD